MSCACVAQRLDAAAFWCGPLVGKIPLVVVVVVVELFGLGWVGIFFCVFFFKFLKNFFYYHYLYYRAGLILTKNPVARKDSNYISVVPIVLLSSLRFFCTC